MTDQKNVPKFSSVAIVFDKMMLSGFLPRYQIDNIHLSNLGSPLNEVSVVDISSTVENKNSSRKPCFRRTLHLFKIAVSKFRHPKAQRAKVLSCVCLFRRLEEKKLEPQKIFILAPTTAIQSRSVHGVNFIASLQFPATIISDNNLQCIYFW